MSDEVNQLYSVYEGMFAHVRHRYSKDCMTEFSQQAIPEVILVAPKRWRDHRGFFAETFHRRRFDENGIRADFVQDNHSMSAMLGTVRGLHFQEPPHAQDKLISVVRGAIYDVAVDIRRASSSYGRYVAVELSAENGHQLFVPKGFAHGFQTLTADTEVFYKVSDFYAPEAERGLHWADPALAIDWPVNPAEATVNERDDGMPTLAELVSPFDCPEGR